MNKKSSVILAFITALCVGAFNALVEDNTQQPSDAEQQTKVVQPNDRIISENTKTSSGATEPLTVLSWNLFNFFNGEGRRKHFPAQRGPKSQAEFLQKKTAVVKVLAQYKPALLAVTELENDGYAVGSAASDLQQAVTDRSALSDQKYAWIQANMNQRGTDQITFGMLYDKEKLHPASKLEVLAAGKSGAPRPIWMQSFRTVKGDQLFYVVLLHLKSRGSACPSDFGGSNKVHCTKERANQLQTLLQWLQTKHFGGPVFVLGDFNETPDYLQKFSRNFDIGLKAANEFSYIYRGDRRLLDHVFVCPSNWRGYHAEVLNGFAEGRSGSYFSFKLPGSKRSMRVSDHNPVLIEINPDKHQESKPLKSRQWMSCNLND